MHGDKGPVKFSVVVTDKSVYKHWRGYHEAKFVKKFDACYESLLEDPEATKQLLHAARVMEILKELDVIKLRGLVMQVFPRYKKTFPRLDNPQKREEFINRVKLCLQKDVESAPEELVYPDWVGAREKEYKTREYDYIPDSPPPPPLA